MENKNQIEPPPEDLAGWQRIVTGSVQHGDVGIYGPARDRIPTDDWVGVAVESCSFDIYRKMDCPRHEGQTKFERNNSLPEWRCISEDGSLSKKELGAKTSDEGKPPLANLPWKALREVAHVQAFGHRKYGDYFNYKKGLEIDRNISCAIRHLADYMDGNDLDSESGRSHIAHAACRILFALENIIEGKAKDTRYKPND